MNINNVVLSGRLTKDPELKYTPSGVAVATFTLAVNRSFTNSQGEREADFINIVVWRKQAENVANYLKKGFMAGVVGRLESRSYEDQTGKRIFVTEVVAENVQFGPNNNGNNNRGVNTSGSNQNGNAGQGSGFNDDPFARDGQPIDIKNDDLPF